MNFKGKAKRIEDIDLPLIGREIGVGEDEVHAILDVESAGSGFDKQGRPKMLFEPHVFWRELGPGPKRDAAAKAGLAYPRWKPGAYPKDSYPRLAQAMAIDENAALRSASWGLGQIMGFNCRMAGYATAEFMVQHFLDDEDRHLRAMITFIKSARLDDELRRHDWKGFARGYNGAGFAKNGYDRKLAAAFVKWQKIKDTPVPVEAAKPITSPVMSQKSSDLIRNTPLRAGEPDEPFMPATPPTSPAQRETASPPPAPKAKGHVTLIVLAVFGAIAAAATGAWNWLLSWF